MPAAAVFCRKGNVRVAKRIVFGFIYFSAHIQSAFKKNTKSAKHKANANKTLFDYKAAGLVHVELFSTHMKGMHHTYAQSSQKCIYKNRK